MVGREDWLSGGILEELILRKSHENKKNFIKKRKCKPWHVLKVCGLDITSLYFSVGRPSPSLFSLPSPSLPHHRLEFVLWKFIRQNFYFVTNNHHTKQRQGFFIFWAKNQKISPRHKQYLMSLNSIIDYIDAFARIQGTVVFMMGCKRNMIIIFKEENSFLVSQNY